MSDTKTAVFGLFHTGEQAERCVDDLISGGFLSDDVSVLMQDQEGTKEFAHQMNTKAAEGATAGGAAGGALGGALGLLVGFGVLAIPGIGPFLVAGPLVAGLAGMGAGGAVGGLFGALMGLGVPEYEAKRYEGHMKDGGVLLSVHCDTEEKITRAKELLKQTGAEDISYRNEAPADFPADKAPPALS